MDDIVIDTNVATLLDAPADVHFKALFIWIRDKGHLALSQHLLNEYNRQGSKLIAVLIKDLGDKGRLNRVKNSELKSFSSDRHFRYRCNPADIPNARTVFLSRRKLLVSLDVNLCNDVNSFQKIDKVKPRAVSHPKPADYE